MKRAEILFSGALLAALAGPVLAADFAGGGTGPIPDNNPAGITVSFNDSAIATGVGRVSLLMDLQHTYAGDLTATLRSPGGAAQLVVFGNIGFAVIQHGNPSNFDGFYKFTDNAAQDIWAMTAPLTDADIVPPDAYRSSGACAAGRLHDELGGGFRGPGGHAGQRHLDPDDCGYATWRHRQYQQRLAQRW
ncbi:MAG TPA: hypothetical protein VFN09_08480 [Rhodanobacteraceae bacterium]|nr:hypothetical protein [Rhodanobacteraceae bacterium]